MGLDNIIVDLFEQLVLIGGSDRENHFVDHNFIPFHQGYLIDIHDVGFMYAYEGLRRQA